ncbi:Uncharacterised protein [Elizabethkingia miricola]|nr:Uncharacterised protein [Elizabethkingia miricola]
MASSLNHIISEIQRKENAISLSAPNAIDEAYQMTIYLKEYLWSIREDITKQGFKKIGKRSISFAISSHIFFPSSFTTIRYFAYRQLALLMEERCTQVIFQNR